MADPPDKKVLKKIPDDDYIDRLSALPDCVLLHILSLFQTKDAAATSILSTRWRNLFFLLPDINLSFWVQNDDGSDRDRPFLNFINFANRVIRQRNKAPVRNISLYVRYFVKRHRLAIESLFLSAAAAISLYNVKELWISVVPMEDKKDKLFSVSIPTGLLTCETLVSLSLHIKVDWVLPSLVCLPNLKKLYLQNKFRLVDLDSIRRFLQGCPLVEELMLVLHPFNFVRESEEDIEVKVLDISIPLLKKLILYLFEEVEFELAIVLESKYLDSVHCFLNGKHKVTINAPNLMSLNISGRVLEVNIIENLMSLDSAMIETDLLYYVTTERELFSRAQHAFKYISGLQNVKSLYLSEDILEALYFSQRVLPTFKNLIKLELGPRYRHFPHRICISKVLSSLFESSPNLEVLIFSEVFKNYFWEDGEFDSVFQEALPLTFTEYLKEIEISDFKGEEHEFKLVEYFLKNGKSLQKIALVRDTWKSVPECCSRILSFKKCSENCKIVFKRKWDCRLPRITEGSETF